jgi:hypothetical protein
VSLPEYVLAHAFTLMLHDQVTSWETSLQACKFVFQLSTLCKKFHQVIYNPKYNTAIFSVIEVYLLQWDPSLFSKQFSKELQKPVEYKRAKAVKKSLVT